MASSLRNKLRPLLTGRTAVVGVGNTLRGDDGIGPELVRRLTGAVHFALFDAGTTPENQLGPVIRAAPETVLIVDALHFGGRPGDIRIFKPEEPGVAAFTTHSLNLEFYTRSLKDRGVAEIVIVGIQPAAVDFSGALSPPVQQALDKLEKILRSLDV
ncbi:MAG: hydrogenase 3 maturation endopeptidase HyCI [Spirochaetales bacterium]|nr:hydrogenase 3 maturation endopeptidase HyCI [Spirochaetales bacterium]